MKNTDVIKDADILYTRKWDKFLLKEYRVPVKTLEFSNTDGKIMELPYKANLLLHHPELMDYQYRKILKALADSHNPMCEPDTRFRYYMSGRNDGECYLVVQKVEPTPRTTVILYESGKVKYIPKEEYVKDYNKR